jgi:hypothetical protein
MLVSVGAPSLLHVSHVIVSFKVTVNIYHIKAGNGILYSVQMIVI